MVNIDGRMIAVKCDTKDTLNIAEMTELQGKLKSRNDVDFDKIKLSIIKYGFSFPRKPIRRTLKVLGNG